MIDIRYAAGKQIVMIVMSDPTLIDNSTPIHDSAPTRACAFLT